MKNTKIEVVSRYAGSIAIKEMNTGIVRTWPKCGDKLYLTEENIYNLVMAPGGRTIVENYLIVKNAEVLEDIEVATEPEYHFEVKEITDLLTNGTEEELIDAINFAPKGVLELIKDISVEIQLPNMNKRKIVDDMLQVDITKMIEIANTESSTEAEVPTVKTRLAKEKAEKRVEEKEGAKKTRSRKGTRVPKPTETQTTEE